MHDPLKLLKNIEFVILDFASLKIFNIENGKLFQENPVYVFKNKNNLETFTYR